MKTKAKLKVKKEKYLENNARSEQSFERKNKKVADQLEGFQKHHAKETTRQSAALSQKDIEHMKNVTSMDG